jgi:hypothetical protein
MSELLANAFIVGHDRIEDSLLLFFLGLRGLRAWHTLLKLHGCTSGSMLASITILVRCYYRKQAKHGNITANCGDACT